MPALTVRRSATTPAVAVLLSAAAAFGLGACSSASGGKPVAAPSGTAASSATAAPSGSGSASAAPGTPSAAPSTASSAPGGASTPPPGAPGGPTPPPELHACTAEQLAVKQADAGVGAGQFYAKLVFTNTSGSTCTLTGYPGVSYVAEDGVQSGNPAARAGGSVTTVSLKPGGSAASTMHDSNGIGGYDPAQCQLSPAQGLRIYPPNQQTALFLPWKTDHCAGPGVHAFTIGPVEALH